MTTLGGAVDETAPYPIRVLNLSAGGDTGGQGIRTKRAFDRHSAFPYRSVVASVRLGYPTDLLVGRNIDRRGVEGLWEKADVIHVRTHLRPWSRLHRARPRPVVLHHHGTMFRADPIELDRQADAIGAVQIVSTIDLLGLARNLVWLPAPYDLAELAAIRKREHRPSKRIRIAHAPTNRVVKSTAVVIEAVARLAERYPIDFDLIEDVPWAECLARKARADIYVDQLHLGYGCNSIEAWGMGMPVVAGIEDPAVRERMVDMLGEVPFHEATVHDLVDRLEELVADPALRRRAARRGTAYVRRWHDDERVVRQLEGLYREAIDRAHAGFIGPVSHGQPNRPPHLVRVEVSPGVFLRLTPAEASRHAPSEAVA